MMFDHMAHLTMICGLPLDLQQSRRMGFFPSLYMEVGGSFSNYGQGLWEEKGMHAYEYQGFHAEADKGISCLENPMGLPCEQKNTPINAQSSFSLYSQGVGAPAGALLAGQRKFIAEAWRVRKLLGGGMRQAGVLAAAALVGLRHMKETLQRDHNNARSFAEGACRVKRGVDKGSSPQVGFTVPFLTVMHTSSCFILCQNVNLSRSALFVLTGSSCPESLAEVFHIFY